MEQLKFNPMMNHLLESLESGTDIGHYGRLVFTMVARHFLPEDELVTLLAGQPGVDERQARAQLIQVKARNYNPPSREKIREWQTQQDFPICPDADNPAGCSLYRDLQFPEGVYENIQNFYEEQAERQSA